MQTRFRTRTLGCTLAKEKADRIRQLLDIVQTSVASLFRQQLLILQQDSIRSFRKTLQSAISGDDTTLPERLQQNLKQALFEFRAKSADIDVPAFSLSSEALYADVSSSLEGLLKDFPESATAKLATLKKLERQVRKQKKKPGNRAINLALSIVGMIRPPGNGNLQGWGTYASSVSGIPLDFLFGIQNDGDSPEVGDFNDISFYFDV